MQEVGRHKVVLFSSKHQQLFKPFKLSSISHFQKIRVNFRNQITQILSKVTQNLLVNCHQEKSLGSTANNSSSTIFKSKDMSVGWSKPESMLNAHRLSKTLSPALVKSGRTSSPSQWSPTSLVYEKTLQMSNVLTNPWSSSKTQPRSMVVTLPLPDTRRP